MISPGVILQMTQCADSFDRYSDRYALTGSSRFPVRVSFFVSTKA